jgi:hypothetical protein
MAGAMGVPVWMLLPYVCDWRWMQEFEDTPWYETVRLFRQRSVGDWDGVFEQISQRLVEAMEQKPFARSTLLFQTRLSYKTEG